MNKYSHLTTSRTSKRKTIMKHMRGAAKGCIRKIGYDTQDKAIIAVGQMTTKYACLMRAYSCPHCLKWHLAKEARIAP